MQEKDDGLDSSWLGGALAVEEDLVRAEPILRDLRSGAKKWRDLSSAERELLVGVPILNYLRESSMQLRYEDPQGMVELAEAARVLADHLSERRYGTPMVADFRARAWADLGNAYRVAGDLETAWRTFRSAVSFLGSKSQFLREIASLLASLLTDLRRFDEAGEILEACLQDPGGRDDAEGTVKILTQLGLLRGYAGEPERAIIILLRALDSLTPFSPHRLAVVHALALNLVDAGHFSSARVLVQRHERLYRKSGKLNTFRRLWLEGKVAYGLAELSKAEGKLNVARLAFRKADQEYDAALVALDLALIYLQQGRRSEVAWLVDEMVHRFRALGIAREAIASLLLLRKSCSDGGRSCEALAAQVETIATILREISRTSRHKLPSS